MVETICSFKPAGEEEFATTAPQHVMADNVLVIPRPHSSKANINSNDTSETDLTQMVDLPNPIAEGAQFDRTTVYTKAACYKSYFRSISYAFVNLLPLQWGFRKPECVLLGERYDLSDSVSRVAFQNHFQSHLLFTYRHGFEPLGLKFQSGVDASEPGSDSRLKSILGLLFKDVSLSYSGGLTSDSGWGCMIRVFQMALAEVLKQVLLGRPWRRPTNHILQDKSQHSEQDCVYPWSLLRIVDLFRDLTEARFSVHRVVETGLELTGIQPGQWFGPTSCARVLTALINGCAAACTSSNNEAHKSALVIDTEPRGKVVFRAYHSENGEIDVSEILEIFSEENSGELNLAVSRSAPAPDLNDEVVAPEFPWPRSATSTPRPEDCVKPPHSKALILFLSFRLGLDSFNLSYQPFIQKCFELPEFKGLAGGGPLTSAYWFIAASNDSLFFLDPHLLVQPAVKSVETEKIRGSRSGAKRSLSLRTGVARCPPAKNDVRPRSSSSRFCQEEVDPNQNQALTEAWTRETETDLVSGLRINGKRTSVKEFEEMFFPSQPRQLGWRSLNPSMTLVFVVKSVNEFFSLASKIKLIDTEGAVLFHGPNSAGRHRKMRNVGGVTGSFTAEEGFLLL